MTTTSVISVTETPKAQIQTISADVTTVIQTSIEVFHSSPFSVKEFKDNVKM